MAGTPDGKPWWRRWFGSRSERAAEKYLRRQGLRILDRNVRTTRGELDLIALDSGCLVFVEVRSREGEDLHLPADSVDAGKQRKLSRAALEYLQRHRLLDQPARFDVVAVAWPGGASQPRIQHIAGAFEPGDRGQMFS